MRYIDGFVLPVPKKNLKAYARMAQKAGKIWRKYGALDYKECAGDDLKVKMGVPFPRQIKVKPGETVVFSYIVYKSRAHRDRVNAEGDEGSAYLRNVRPEGHALRSQAHGLRRIQGPGRRLTLTLGRRCFGICRDIGGTDRQTGQSQGIKKPANRRFINRLQKTRSLCRWLERHLRCK